MMSRTMKVHGITWGTAEQGGTRQRTVSTWTHALKWNRQAKATGKPIRVFCMSLGDVFETYDGEILKCILCGWSGSENMVKDRDHCPRCNGQGWAQRSGMD